MVDEYAAMNVADAAADKLLQINEMKERITSLPVVKISYLRQHNGFDCGVCSILAWEHSVKNFELLLGACSSNGDEQQGAVFAAYPLSLFGEPIEIPHRSETTHTKIMVIRLYFILDHTFT